MIGRILCASRRSARDDRETISAPFSRQTPALAAAGRVHIIIEFSGTDRLGGHIEFSGTDRLGGHVVGPVLWHCRSRLARRLSSGLLDGFVNLSVSATRIGLSSLDLPVQQGDRRRRAARANPVLSGRRVSSCGCSARGGRTGHLELPAGDPESPAGVPFIVAAVLGMDRVRLDVPVIPPALPV